MHICTEYSTFFSEKGVKELTLATNSIDRVKIMCFSLEGFLYSVLKARVWSQWYSIPVNVRYMPDIREMDTGLE